MTLVYLLIAVVVTATVLWAYFTAQRLNRLHIRTDSARQALQAALDRRAALVGALLPDAAEASKRAEAIPWNTPASPNAPAPNEKSLNSS